MFLLVTSRRNELEGRATSQIVGNLNAILNLSNFFEIDAELAEILPLEVDRMITKFLGSIGDHDGMGKPLPLLKRPRWGQL